MPIIVRNYSLFVAVLALLTLLLSNQSWLATMEDGVYRSLLRTLPGKAIGKDVAVIEIDSTSLAEYGSWPWSSTTLARFMTKVTSLGAASQVYTSTLLYPDATDNAAITTGIKQTRAIFLNIPYLSGDLSGLSFGEMNVVPFPIVNPNSRTIMAWAKQWFLGQTFASEKILAIPSKTLATVASGVGVSDASVQLPDSIGSALLIADQDLVFPALSLLVTANVLDQRLADIRVSRQNTLSMGNRRLKLDENFRYLPYPYRKTDSVDKILSFSAADVLKNRVSRAKLRNKVVVIGIKVPLSGTHTAVGESNSQDPMWTAFLIQSMLSESSIWRPYWAAAFQKVLIVLLALYLLFLPLRFQGRIGLAIGAALFIILLNIELLGLLVYHAWLPLLLPAMFILTGHVLISFRYRFSAYVTTLQNDVGDSYRALANNLLSQGKLDDAFDKYQKCVSSEKLLQDLYLLGIEYERRRQFSKALIVYEHITQFDPSYRDIKERRERHFSNSDKFSLISSLSGNFGETLVVDDPNIAQPILGRYEIIESIGKGAMGTVFLGKDPKIGRTVAIKTLPLSKEFDTQQLDSVRSRFYREAETAGRLSHPNIVTIYDVGEEHDLAYIAMDYIEGSSLENYTRPGYLLSIEEVFIIGITVADALDYAHKQSVVHRDIKPANVMYNAHDRVIKVTDFGIACLTDKSKTMTGTVLGSPSYMSPEQLEGKKLNGGSDIFSLGVTLFQLFTGTLPFNAETMASLAYKIANEKPKSIRKVRQELPSCLTRVINRSLEKNIKQRYQTGGEMADALRKCAS